MTPRSPTPRSSPLVRDVSRPWLARAAGRNPAARPASPGRLSPRFGRRLGIAERECPAAGRLQNWSVSSSGRSRAQHHRPCAPCSCQRPPTSSAAVPNPSIFANSCAFAAGSAHASGTPHRPRSPVPPPRPRPPGRSSGHRPAGLLDRLEHLGRCSNTSNSGSAAS